MTKPVTPNSSVQQIQSKPYSFRKRQTLVLILGVITLVLLGMLIAQGSLDIIPIISPTTASSTMVLYALSTLNSIAILLLLVFLVRNWLKLNQERQQKQLGSKFKTKMVVGSVAIAMLPVIMLFFFSYGLINRSLDKWFSLPAERVQKDAQFIREKFLEREIDNLDYIAHSFVKISYNYENVNSENISIDSNEVNLTPKIFKVLEKEFKDQDLTRLLIVSRDGKIQFSLGDASLDSLIERQNLNAKIANGEHVKNILNAVDGNIYILVGVPIKNISSPSKFQLPIFKFQKTSGKKIGELLLLRVLPQEISKKVEDLFKEAKDRAALTVQNRRIKFTYILILSFVTLLLIVGSTWIALHVSRKMVIPIQALAEGTQAVAQGNLDFYIDCLAEDELAILVDSFNNMAGQLRANRTQLEETTTQLRSTNSALEERRSYIETILQSLFTGVISLDADNYLTTINQAGIDLLGIDHIVLGEPLTNYFSEENCVKLFRLLRRAKKLRQYTSEMQLIPKNRKPISVAVTATVLKNEDKMYKGAVLTIEDLSPLIAAQRSVAWSEVARRMAHEIKNPLTPIQLSAERITRNLNKYGINSERAVKTINECTTIIEHEVSTLQRMVSEFSRFAKLPDAHVEPSSLNDVVKNTVRLYLDRLNGVSLNTNLDDNLPLINIDREQFKRTLVNLIDNAIYAIEQVNGNTEKSLDSCITIITEYKADQDIVRLSVIDTGCGIAQEDREHLFHPYFSKRKRGTGLGLAIVHHIIADHNGQIFVEDNFPHGAKFIIELPTLNC